MNKKKMVKVIKSLFVAFLVMTTLIASVFAMPIEVTSFNVQEIDGEYLAIVSLTNSNVTVGDYDGLEFVFNGQAKNFGAVTVGAGQTVTLDPINLLDTVVDASALKTGQTYVISARTVGTPSTELSDTFVYGQVDGDDNDDVTVTEIRVNGRRMTSNSKVQVQAGGTLDIEVDFTVQGGQNVDDAKITASIGGYRFDIRGSTGQEDYLSGIDYTEAIKLSLPTDMDTQEDYSLKITGEGRTVDIIDVEYTLYIDAERHLLNIIDLVKTPNSGVEAGEHLITSVVMENIGQKLQDRVKVTVEIPDLNLEEVTHVMNLDKGDSVTSDDLLFFVDEDTEAGRYDVVVTLSYDDYYETTTKTFDLVVKAPDVIAEENLMVNFNNNINMVAGQAKSFKVVIANPNAESKPISVAALENTWADVEIDPSLSMVKGGDSSEYTVTVTPKDSISGERAMTLLIKEGSNTIKELTVSTYIEGQEEINWVNVALAVLLVIAIIILLSLIITIAKRKNDDHDEYSSTEEYY